MLVGRLTLLALILGAQPVRIQERQGRSSHGPHIPVSSGATSHASQPKPSLSLLQLKRGPAIIELRPDPVQQEDRERGLGTCGHCAVTQKVSVIQCVAHIVSSLPLHLEIHFLPIFTAEDLV